MQQTVSYALVGCGRIAPNHLAAALACPQLKITALCDLRRERAAALAKEYGLAVPIYTRVEELLAHQHPNLVAVATDSGSHLAVAQAAVRAGACVLVEKPLGLSLSGIDALLALARQKGVLVGACHQNRFNKATQFLHRAIQAGEMGRLWSITANVRWNRGEAYYRQAPWRGSWQGDGGTLMNQCIHNVDLMLWMAGERPDQVFAYTGRMNHPYIEAEDFGAALLHFPQGCYGILEGTTNAFGQNFEETLTVLGERGTVRLGGRSVNRVERCLLAARGEEEGEAPLCDRYSEDPPNIYGYGHTPLYRDMLRAMEGSASPLIDGPAGRAAVEVVLAIYRSAAENRPVTLPLPDTATTDFTGLFDR